MPLVLLVAGAVMAGIVLFGLVVGCGTLAVRLLKLPADPPEEAAYEPSSPTLVAGADAVGARARAQAWNEAAALGRRARAVLLCARSSADLAEWVAEGRPDSAAPARSAAGLAAAAAERARTAFTAGDVGALAAAELAAATASAQISALAAGLPDWRVAERRKLLALSAALCAALALAAVAMWLR
jgi:hypothetical protein